MTLLQIQAGSLLVRKSKESFRSAFGLPQIKEGLHFTGLLSIGMDAPKWLRELRTVIFDLPALFRYSSAAGELSLQGRHWIGSSIPSSVEQMGKGFRAASENGLPIEAATRIPELIE